MENKKIEANAEHIAEQQLEQVVGGTDGRATRTINGITFYGHVTKYRGVVGRYYYITNDYRAEWYYGELVKTWEKDDFWGIFGTTVRTHRLRVILNNGANVENYGIEMEFSGDHFTLYTDATGI